MADERSIPEGMPSEGFKGRLALIPDELRLQAVEYLDETYHLLGYEEPCEVFACEDWPAIIEDLLDAVRAWGREGRDGLDLTLVGEDFGRYIDNC